MGCSVDMCSSLVSSRGCRGAGPGASPSTPFLLYSLTWLPEGLNCVPCLELAVSGNEQLHPFPHRGCSCSPLPAASTWTRISSAEYHIEWYQRQYEQKGGWIPKLAKTEQDSPMPVPNCGWNLNRLQMTDNATKEPLRVWFWDGEWLIQKKCWCPTCMSLTAVTAVVSLFTPPFLAPAVGHPPGPGSWSALNRLTAPLSQEEESKRTFFHLVCQ